MFAWTVPADVPGAEDTIKIPTNIGSGVTLLTDAGLVLNGGIIQALGSVANIRHGQYTTSSQADTTGPALAAGAQGATVNGTELELTFERKAGVAEHLDETSVPAASDFAVVVQSVGRTVSAVAVNGATVTLTLSEPMGHAETVTVRYTPGANRIKDLWGNDAPGFSSRAVRNDSPEPELSVADVMVDEGDGTAEFTVTLDVASGETVTVDYATSNGTAVAGSDYTAKSGTLTFAAGQTSKDIEVALADDSISEADEDFTLTLNNASNAGIDVGTATATITDNESTPTLTIADARATESGAVEFTVTLDPASSSDVTVEYATTDGTATADSADPDGADYTAPASGAQLIISASQTSGTISIATGDDTVFEADETFTVTLASPSSNAVLGTQKTATGTIENNDAASTDTALKALTITAAGSEVTLLPTFAVEEHNYRASVDNTVASVSVAAEANHRKATVAIIEGTDLAFGENTLTLRVTAEDGITTQDYTVTVTRALPELTWESQSTLSLDEDAGAVELTVTLTPASSDQVTVDYTTLAASAVEGEDYTQASGTLTFAAGETQKTITVTILDDTLYEPVSVDGILVELSNVTGTAVLGRTTVYLQIQDNDSPPAATMENVTVDEGAGTMVFTLSLAHGIDTDIEYRANANEVGGTANEGIDYSPFIPGTGVVKLEIPARQTSATFAVTILDDDVHEADETISMRWSENSGHVATASIDVTGTITNDDERGVAVTPTTLTVPEAGSGTYTVVLTSQPTGDVTVTPSVSGNTDVTVSGALTFTAGTWSTAQTVTVSAAADTDAVNDTAVVSHAVSGADYESETASDVTVTVTDDETVSTGVVLSVDPATVSEDAGATVVTVTGTLNHAPRLADTEVTLTVGNTGDAAVEGTDYGTIESLTLTIAAGSASGTKTFTLTPADDDAAGADRALTVAGNAAGLAVTAAAVTIEEDDERGVTVTPTALTVPEAGSATYTVALTSQPTGTVTVTPSVSGNSEVTVSGALTFTARTWSTAQTVTVSAAADTDAADDTAVVSHAVSGGDYGTVTASDVSVTVTDDETVSTGVVLSVDPSTVSEDAGATVVTVTGTLNHAPRLADTDVTLTVGDADDAAVEGTDYGTVGSLTLTIAAGSASGTKTFTLAPADDDVDEGDEALTVDGSVTGLAVTAAELTIEEDDERGVTVTPTSLTVPEGESGTYTVVLGSQPTGSVTVALSRSGSSDVTVAPSPLTFTAGNWSTAQTVTVSAAADTDAVNDTATVTHAVSSGDYGTVTAAAVSVTVSDDETVSDIPGEVTGLSATASVNKVRLAWTAPQGAILGYRIEVSHDSGSLWADVEANTHSTDTSYAHGSGLMAGETRHYRVSAITEDGAGTPSAAVDANATDTVDGLTATGLAIEDTPNGMATIDLCWKPTGVAASDLKNFAIRKRHIHPSYPAEWSDQHWSPSGKSRAADCEAGSIGFRVSGSIAPNIRNAYQIRARYGMRWALSNDAEAVSVDAALELRADVLTGNSSLSVDTDVPATVCPAYDDPATPEADAGSFIVNIGFSTGPAVLLHYEAVTGFVLDNDVTLENATAELIDRPYGAQLGYRVRITPTTWGQPVAVSVPAGVVTHPESSVPNQASNVFQRDTSAATDCDTGSDITVYPPAVRRAEILDDDDRSGMWSTGERVRATLEFTEPVTVTTDNGIPTVSLIIDGKTVQASYAEGTGGDTLAFEHVVTAEQSPFNSASLVANSLSLNGGVIVSLDGPAAALAHPGAVKRKKPATKPNKPKLTAEWVKFPPGHSGDGRKFTVRVKFSDPVTINARYFRDYALSVTGGAVDKVWRVKGSDGERRSDMWAIRVTPTSQQPLSLSLAAIQDCSEHGAICTADGTPLSNAASITVTGPNHDLTVADAEVEEGPGAALAFVVTLSGTAPYRVKVDYATSDGTATAGSDYTATSGTLIFERGETSKTISVPVLDDAHDDDGETLTLTLSDPKRAMIVDGEAVGTIRNTDPMPRAWLARFGRTVADQVLAVVEGRLQAARLPGVEAQLAGQRISGPAAPGGGKADEAEAEARLLALSDWMRGGDCRGGSGRAGECAPDGQWGVQSREATERDLLTGSSIALTDGTEDSGSTAVWAQGTVGRFDGREGAVSIDGEVVSGMLGVDWTRGRGTAGLVVARSHGEAAIARRRAAARSPRR